MGHVIKLVNHTTLWRDFGILFLSLLEFGLEFSSYHTHCISHTLLTAYSKNPSVKPDGWK